MPKRLNQISFSLLDPVEIRENDLHIADAIHRKARLVQLAESIGFTRYWFMHHPSVADQGSAASILLSHLASMSSVITIGTDLLLRSTSAAMALEKTYRVLDGLYPRRIEGIFTGGSPSRQKNGNDPFFSTATLHWMLGTDTEHAEQAGKSGMPFAFASHLAPALLMDALEKYRSSFRPSACLSKPYTLASVHAIIAASDEEADYLASSLHLMVLNLLKKKPKPLPPPIPSLHQAASEEEWAAVRRMLWFSFFGTSASVRYSLQSFVDQTDVDELMICSAVFDEQAEAASLRAIADVFGNTTC